MDFETIRSFHKPCTPGALAAKYPGFYSDECYEILADYFNNNKDGLNKNNKRKLEELEETDSGVEESKGDVSSTEFIITQCEHTGIIEGST